uniref:Uncharacterized protein n=1 Tax=Desertifilum tharense IPPAS B-1220 TaxID=1781255 RepID=A0ACD5GNP8_9CYAN
MSDYGRSRSQNRSTRRYLQPDARYLIRGRVYYNLISWYKVLALLPGFQVNRRFMEQMMGVSEGLPEEIVSQLSQANWQNRLRDSLDLVGTLVGLVPQLFHPSPSNSKILSTPQPCFTRISTSCTFNRITSRRTDKPLSRLRKTATHSLGCTLSE